LNLDINIEGYIGMSHLVKKACALSDLSTLLDAARNIGWDVHQGGKAKFFSGYSEECDFVMTPVGEVNDRGEGLRYTIGVKLGEHGAISLLYDNAMNSRNVLYGDEEDACTQRILGKLKQSYQVVAARKVAQRKGWRVSEQTRADGKVVLKLQGLR